MFAPKSEDGGAATGVICAACASITKGGDSAAASNLAEWGGILTWEDGEFAVNVVR